MVVCGSYGCATSSVASLTVIDPAIVTHPVSQTAEAGNSVTFTVSAVGTGPITYQWRKQETPIANATNTTLTLANLSGTDVGSYGVVVCGSYGCITSSVAVLTVNFVDLSFNPGANNSVYSLMVQADGKILAGGTFSTLGGQNRSGLGRVNADGTLDPTFDPGVGAGSAVYCLAAQADGKILVGGWFFTLGGQSRSFIGRLNADGTVEATFNPGANSQVYALVVQADGKILVGGGFTTLGGQSRRGIGRLNADGTVDATFNPGVSSTVYSLALQTDGKILVGGYFSTLGGQSRNNLGRLNADGTVDATFNPGASGNVYSLASQADGKILAAGGFMALGGESRSYIGRLNADGTVDATFNPGANSPATSLALQVDGKILVGGGFSTLGGQSRRGMGRLNADGTIDTTFNVVVNDTVYSVGLQPDGKILVGGYFSTLGGQSRNYLGRLTNTGPTIQSLTYDGASLSWMRGGSAPELSRVTLDVWQNGGWSNVASLARIAGGWQTSGLGLSSNTTVRVQGCIPGGYGNGSSGISELFSGGLSITVQPASRTNNAGTVATFTAAAVGGEPLGYQWFKGATPLAAGGNVAGSANSTLVLSNLLASDAGQYFVVVTNAYGAVTSSVVSLVIIDPAILSQPISQTASYGGSTTFTVGAAGTGLTYQWRLLGTLLEGATNANLALTNLSQGAAGSYGVVVCSSHGCVTSSVASLTVLDPVIITQPISQSVNDGSDVTFTVSAAGTGTISYQWRWQETPLNGATLNALTLTNLSSANNGNYDVVVCGSYGCITSSVAVLSVSFVDFSFNPGANNNVGSLVVQADRKILVGGLFTTLGGQTRNHIARLNADGTLDSGFNPGANKTVYSVTVQADGKILVGGQFTTLGGQPRNYIGRLNADGTLDSGFNPSASSGVYSITDVYSITVQADGKILVGGDFTTLGGQTRNYIARLNADGTLDSGFNPGANKTVYSVTVQADGKILVGGQFTTLGGQTRNYIGRLNADGTLDSGFNPGADNAVWSVTVQADGKILVGGGFTTLGGQARNYIARLNADGTLDSGFNPGANNSVLSFAIQADGKIMVGGNFTTLGGQTRNRIATLNVEGTLDTTFNPGADGQVLSLAMQADGKILVGGRFNTLSGQGRGGIARLENTEPAIQSLGFTGDSLTWLRGGSAPELSLATLDVWQSGTWSNVARLARIAGGWQSTGLGFPSNTTIRVQGRIPGGRCNGSSGIEETVSGGPSITAQPASRTNSPGTVATFTVSAIGGGPLGYQWFKGATRLSDDGNIAGSSSPTLSLSNVGAANGVGYFVVITNNYGAVTSSVALLTVPNNAPTLAPVSNQVVNEDAGEQSIDLTGISAGANDTDQNLTITAISSDPSIVPEPAVNYTSLNATGTLFYTPTPNASGSVTITVVMMDDGGTANGGINSLTNTFTVTVNPVNDPPTLAAISNVSFNEDAGQQTVNLSGISAGPANEAGQSLAVTATSSATSIIPHPTVTYTSPGATGTLAFTPVANANGISTITVVVQDDGGTANGGLDAVTNTFTVTVNAVNDAPVANPATYGRAWGASLRILKTDLLSHTSDVEGDTRTIVWAGGGTNGSNIATNSTYVLFAPTNNLSESFLYAVGDGNLYATNLVTVLVTNAVSSVNSISSTGGAVTITFAGVPGFSYVVERSGSSSDWSGATVVQTTNAPASGTWMYTEASPPNPSFYRSRQNN